MLQQGIQYAATSIKPDTSQKQTGLDLHSTRLHGLLVDARMTHDRLSSMRERAVGPTSPANEKASAREVRGGIYGKLCDVTDEIVGVLDAIRDKVDELSDFV